MPTRNHPTQDKAVTKFNWNGVHLEIKKKFPMFAFMKNLEKSPIDALSLILTEESLETLMNVDMDFKDLVNLMTIVAEILGVEDSGN